MPPSLDLDQLEREIAEACQAAERTSNAARSLQERSEALRDAYLSAVEQCHGLQLATASAHPVLQERARRAIALLQRAARRPLDSELPHQKLQSELQALRESPLWTERIRAARRRQPAPIPALRPGPTPIAVYYECAGMHLCARGRLLYLIKDADPFGAYALRRNQPLTLFPDYRSLGRRPGSAIHTGMMVFEAASGQAPLGLLYERLLAVTPAAESEGPIEELSQPHDAIAGRLRRQRQSWLLVKN